MTTLDKAGKKSVFKNDERVVYTEKAMCPAYVVAVERVNDPPASSKTTKPKKKVPAVVRYKNTKRGRPGAQLMMVTR